MQVRVMAACMESQADILEYTASAQSGWREVTACFSLMSMIPTHLCVMVFMVAPPFFPYTLCMVAMSAMPLLFRLSKLLQV